MPSFAQIRKVRPRYLKTYTFRPCFLLFPILIYTFVFSTDCSADQPESIGKQKIVAVIPPDFPPTYFRDPNTGQAAGLAVDVTNELAKIAGVQIEYRFASAWDEIEKMTQSGEADIIPFRAINERTEKSFIFTHPLDVTPVNYIVRATDVVQDTIKDQTKLKISVIEGSTANMWLKKYSQDTEIIPYKNFEKILMSLLTGEVDKVLTVSENLVNLAEKAGLSQRIKVIAPAAFEIKRGIALRPSDQVLLEKLNKAISIFESSPRQKEIVQNWLGQAPPWWTVRRVLFASGSLSLFLLLSVLTWRFIGINRLAIRLQNEKSFLQTVIDAIPEPIFFRDGEGRFTGCNTFFLDEIVGRPRHEIVGKKIALDWLPDCDKATTSESPGKADCTVKLQNSNSVLLEILTIPFQIKDKEAGFISIGRDITARDSNHRLQVEARQKLQTFLDNIPMLAWLKDAAGKYEMVNKNYADYCGRQHSDLIGKNEFDIFPREFAEILAAEDQRVYDSDSRQEFEKVVHLSGESAVFHTYKTPIHDENGIICGTAGISLNITEQKQAMETLQRFQILVNHSRDIILFLRFTDLRVMEANRAAQLAYGYSREQLLDMTIADLRASSPNTDPVFERQLEQANTHGILFETLHRRSDGTVFPVEVSAQGETIGDSRMIVSIIRDITDRKNNEDSLIRSEALYKRLFAEFQGVLEAIPDSVALISPDLNVMWANSTAIKSMVDNSEKYQGVACHKLWKISEEPCEDCRLRETLKTGKTSDFIISSEGKTLEYRFIPVKDQTGEIITMVRLGRDITVTKNLEDQLRQAQKLEALGTLSGGIAHDFNNVLSPIIGYAEIAQEDAADNEELRNALEQILAGANRAKDLIRQILTFSRMGRSKQMQPLEISSIVKEVIRFMRASLPATITINQTVERGTMVGDATQIHQIMINLCTNASHAMDGVGILDISLTNAFLTEEEIEKRPALNKLKAGEHLRLTIADTGHGMDSATLQRIFDPFFTTKGPEQGTGLGLAVVHGIVQEHNGAIIVESTPGRGSVFTMYFPKVLHDDDPRTVERTELFQGSERILVIDDEQAVARMLSIILEHSGYKVTYMTNPNEALANFRSSPDEYDLVLTDFTMPIKTGVELAEKMLDLRPDLPIILCTGFSNTLTEEAARKKGIRAILMKPIDSNTLRKKVWHIFHDNDSV